MDLYSSDVGAIQEGNMRSQAIMNANNNVREHNNNLAGQIAQLKSQQKSADVEEGIKDAIGGTIASGKIAGKVKAYKDWTANQKASNPTTQAENGLKDAGADAPTTPPTADDPPSIPSSVDELKDNVKTGVMNKAKQGIKNALGVSDETLDVAGKGIGEIASVGMAGMDIYKDIKSGGIAGDNWASKTSNVLQIGGAIADLGGTIFPPLALLGGAMDIASGVSGEIGDLIDSGKQDKETDDLKQQETEQTQTITSDAPASTGRVS